MRTRDIGKEQLVKEKAIEMIVRDGLESFSVNKLAKACNISVATLYIYYKDKDDLIIKIGIEEVHRMSARMAKGLDPEASFAVGLKQQWKNRVKQMTENPTPQLFFEQLRNSSYQGKIIGSFEDAFKDTLGRFLKNVIARGEIDAMPFEVYWSVAFAPLYTLIRFDKEGKSLAGRPFKMTNKMMWQTFELVLKAFKK